MVTGYGIIIANMHLVVSFSYNTDAQNPKTLRYWTPVSNYKLRFRNKNFNQWPVQGSGVLQALRVKRALAQIPSPARRLHRLPHGLWKGERMPQFQLFPRNQILQVEFFQPTFESGEYCFQSKYHLLRNGVSLARRNTVVSFRIWRSSYRRYQVRIRLAHVNIYYD